MTKRNMTIILLFAKKQICLQHLKIKIEIIYSLVNLCGKNKHRYPINKKKKKETEETNSVTIIPHKATRR